MIRTHQLEARVGNSMELANMTTRTKAGMSALSIW
eukprot:CAMPEP_0180668870 /NCGR_PEP_ID=MMETSP1037_2-20121125/63166_1 /TAXON_ID=632150 /ORGANISM="Azadinium spinosum, Strain 3D9" /LENGTH=34 /DNA_ID= /DNA_START= /DNA_END= /DNA_ORIENTATION=